MAIHRRMMEAGITILIGMINIRSCINQNL